MKIVRILFIIGLGISTSLFTIQQEKPTNLSCVNGTKESYQAPITCDNCLDLIGACKKHGGPSPSDWNTHCNQCIPRLVHCASGKVKVIKRSEPDTQKYKRCFNCFKAIKACAQEGGIKPNTWPTYCNECDVKQGAQEKDTSVSWQEWLTSWLTKATPNQRSAFEEVINMMMGLFGDNKQPQPKRN